VTLVLDASVVIKWLLKDPEREAGTEMARQIMERVATGGEACCSPSIGL
jgi:hypothetical protein